MFYLKFKSLSKDFMTLLCKKSAFRLATKNRKRNQKPKSRKVKNRKLLLPTKFVWLEKGIKPLKKYTNRWKKHTQALKISSDKCALKVSSSWVWGVSLNHSLILFSIWHWRFVCAVVVDCRRWWCCCWLWLH